MFSQMQNVVSSRELFSSNPCRDMWESQQCSQAASGSQNSQGSYELFSQPLRQSQQKGSAYDKWSQHGSSQQTNEGESLKYYMKYMTKPSLFSDKDKQGNDKIFSQVPSYREHIEIQKKKAAERDERDMLDSFIALLKDYQKEVKSALDSFKKNVDSTLAKKAEEIVAGADQSAGMIANLKEELKEHFLNLRKEMEEHQRLKETIAKQETKIEQKETQLRLLQDQLNDYRDREKRAVQKEQNYLEREKELTSKLKELNTARPSVLRDTPPMSQQSNIGNDVYQVSRNETMNQNECHQGTGFPTMMLHHLPPPDLSQAPVVPNIACRPNPPVATHIYQQQNIRNQLRPTPGVIAFQADDNVVQKNTQSVTSLQYGTEPVLPFSTAQHDKSYYPTGDNNLSSCVGPAKVGPIPQHDGHGGHNGPSTAIESFTWNKYGQGAFRSSAIAAKAGNQLNCSIGCRGKNFTSPGNNHIPYFRAANLPKRSPVATVHPQVQVKAEEFPIKSKFLAQQCQRKNQADREDPFDIFTFDLTDSPETANNETVESSTAQKESQIEGCNNVVKKAQVKTYNTRSRQEASRKLVAGQLDNKNARQISTVNQKGAHFNAAKKVYMKSVNVTRPAQPSDEDDSQGFEISFDAPPKKAVLTRKAMENQEVQGKKCNNKKPKPALFRQALTAKRKLPSGSSLFDILDDDDNDLSIQKITESLSIRKHTVQRKLKRMKNM